MSFQHTSEFATPQAALDRLVRLIESQMPAMRASVLLLDDDGMTLRHGAAPHLPPDYCRAVDGSRIGPAAGSCGTAAWRREQVIVTDIATDPLWADYKSLALGHGLRACWSTPILDNRDRVLGTFAMYYEEPREPKAGELALTGTATLLASNILVRARTEENLRVSEAKMRLARAEAEHANKVKSEFLAMMSHELRTPLNAIGGYAKLMADGVPDPVTERQRGYLGKIIRSQEHLLSLIESVLMQSRIEAGRMNYQMANIGVGELLEVAETMLLPQLAEKALEYDCSEADPHLVLRGDRQKTAQILLNLVSNAVKFTPPRGRIAIRTTEPAPGRVVIGVRDTGVGMSEEEIATVFEPYVQFDNTQTRKEKGTGLGMPISRELARGMGGELTVESRPGEGTEFQLMLAADSHQAPRE